jgi:alkylation response protein AidB-like acyl-CoA dehydrogenase
MPFDGSAEPEVEFRYSQEQEALRELAARLCGERYDDEFRKRFRRTGAAYDATLWQALAQAGVLGTAIAPAHGGSGLGMCELGLVLEAQGRSLAPVPLLATLVLGALPLQHFGTRAQCALLSEVNRGSLLLTGALEEEGADPLTPQTRAVAGGTGWELSGRKTCVPYAAEAAYLLVSAQTADMGTGLFLVPAAAAGLQLELQQSTSGQPQAQLLLNAVRLESAARLGGPAGAGALAWTLERAHLALAALQLGILASALERAASYVRERHQFGRPIGSFQAVQHRLADCYIDLEALRSSYLRAVWALDAGVGSRAEVLATKWWSAQAGHRVTHAVQHLHGGLGADLEYPVHAYFLAAKQLEVSLGGAAPMLAALGAELASGAVVPFTGNSQ